MSRALIELGSAHQRAQAMNLIGRAPPGTRVEFKGPRRSNDQNSLMWALLTEIATQLTWHGQRYSAEDWKDFLMHQLGRGRWMPAEEGGMVPIGFRTSDLSREEMSDFIELILAFAARHDVQISDTAGNPAGGAGRTIQPDTQKVRPAQHTGEAA